MTSDIRDLKALKDAVRSGTQPKYLFFWGHRPRKDGKIGKSCLYVNKLADVDSDVLRSLIKHSYTHMKETNS